MSGLDCMPVDCICLLSASDLKLSDTFQHSQMVSPHSQGNPRGSGIWAAEIWAQSKASNSRFCRSVPHHQHPPGYRSCTSEGCAPVSHRSWIELLTSIMNLQDGYSLLCRFVVCRSRRAQWKGPEQWETSPLFTLEIQTTISLKCQTITSQHYRKLLKCPEVSVTPK